MKGAILAIDIGGTKTRVALSEDGKTFSEMKKFPTLFEFNDQIKRLVEEIKPFTSRVDRVAIGAAGAQDRGEGKLIWWGQRESWWGQSFFEPIKKIFPDAKLTLENDADIAALGEAKFGAGREYSIVSYLTLSSGIGGGLVINGKVPPYMFGFEVGHQIINSNETERWACGQKGCFESYASGFAFKKIFGVAGEFCDDPEIWDNYATLLAPGVANIISIWSPEVIVLGGGVSNRFDLFIEPLKRELPKIIPFKLPEIKHAELDEPGLYGGLALYA